MKTYQLIAHDSDFFLLVNCDLDMALKLEQQKLWQLGEAVNTDDCFMYQVNDQITDSLLCLVNFGFVEVSNPLALLSVMCERLVLVASRSLCEDLQASYGWPYGQPHKYDTRVSHYEIQDTEITYTEIKEFLNRNNVQVLEF